MPALAANNRPTMFAAKMATWTKAEIGVAVDFWKKKTLYKRTMIGPI